MSLTNKNKKLLIVTIVLLGIFARFVVMQIGHNFDFESYCIVGKLVSEGKSVYANTTRYNYGFIFFLIQGLLYKMSLLFNDNILAYRILMVSVLTLTDLLISFFIYKKKNIKTALLFFINPVSIIISGYHNQFDNIAILLALITIYFYNDDEKLNKNDFFFVLFASLSLITKHIFAFFPLFIIFNKTINLKKKILYAFVPAIIFFISFIPFALSSKDAFMGIINNVFLYKSSANYPLLILILHFIPINKSFYICIFILFMLIMSYILKKYYYSKLLYYYLIVMVACSSAIANQYLVIPIVSLFLLDDSYKKYLYIFIATVILLYRGDGLKLYSILYNNLAVYNTKLINLIDKCINYGGYIIACWLLLVVAIILLKNHHN